MSPSTYAIPGYRLENPIGDGNAGKVFAARHLSDRSNSPSSLVAIKIIPRSKVADAARREVDIHLHLEHPNIATLHRVTTASIPHSNSSPTTSHPSPPSPTSLALVMEYGSAGDMFTEVATAQFLPARLVRRRLVQIASALQFLHRNRIVHLDVKLENVILTRTATPKLIDFGCARHLDSTQPLNTTLGGTLHYLAPEVVANSDALPSTANDAWALGVLIYTALIGNYPFNPVTRSSQQDEDDEIKKRILHSAPHPIPSSLQIPSDLVTIIHGLLEKDPSKRMTISKVLQIAQATPDFTTRRYPNRIYSTQINVSKIDPNAHHRRPRSPSGTPDADFAPVDVEQPQAKADALRVVDRIIRSRMTAATDINRLFAPINRHSSPNSPSKCNSKPSHHSEQQRNDNVQQLESHD